MKKFIKYKWPDEVIHALGDMGMIAPGIIQKKSYRLIEKSQSFILNVDSSKDRLLSIIPPLLASMIHEEKTQIILLGHKNIINTHNIVLLHLILVPIHLKNARQFIRVLIYSLLRLLNY